MEQVHDIRYEQGTEIIARRKSICEKVGNEGGEVQE